MSGTNLKLSTLFGLFTFVAASLYTVAAPLPQTHSITDLAGHTINIPSEPRHIACLEVLCYQKIFVLGENKKISQMVTTNAPWMETINLTVKTIPKVLNGDANIEDLLSRKTDLIFYRYNPEQVAALYARAGIPALYSQPLTKPNETVDEFLAGQRQALRLFADALNTQQARNKTEDWIKYHDQKVAWIRARLHNLPASQRLRTYYLRGPDALSTQGRGSNTFWYGELAGADMIVKRMGTLQGKGSVTMEAMVSWDPQVIFVGRQYPISLVTEDPRWKAISAVKNNRIYPLPDGVFFWDGGLEGVLLMEYEAKTLYPDRFQDLDLNNEIREFYHRFYRYEMSDTELKKILSGESPAGTRINLMNN